MIRPDAAALLTLWREALIGGALVAGGLWLWLVFSGLIALFGAVGIAVGAILLLSGVRAARFRAQTEAPGVVQVVEGRISYMGPILGGVVDIDALSEVSFRRTTQGEGFWRLAHDADKPLMIPEGAAGSGALLDALAPLPGLDTGAMVRAVQKRTAGTTVVWRRDRLRALT